MRATREANGQNNKSKAKLSEPLQRCFREHLQFFVRRDLANTTVTQELVDILPSQELAFCRGTVLEEANEFSLPRVPSLLLLPRIGVWRIYLFRKFDIHDGDVIQLS